MSQKLYYHKKEQFVLKQSRQPQKNDKLLFFSRDRDSWQIISVISNVNKRFLKNGWYFNFRYLDELEDGSYFHPGKPYWGIVSEDDVANLDLDRVVPVLEQCQDDSPPSQLDMETDSDPTTVSNTIAQMDWAGTPESLTPVNSKEPSPEVSADTSDQIQDKETENRDDCGEDSSARELRRISRAKHKNELDVEQLSRQSMGYRLRSSTAFDILEEYQDEEYSDQRSIYGDAEEEHFVNQLLTFTLVRN